MTDFLIMEKEFLQSIELEKLMQEENLINEHIFGPVVEC
jgi:hypothetical protein